MKILIAIIIILILLGWLVSLLNRPKRIKGVSSINVEPVIKDEISEEPDWLMDESGRRFLDVRKTRQIERRTYIIGRLKGKYYGDLLTDKSDQFLQESFYDFTIYECDIFIHPGKIIENEDETASQGIWPQQIFPYKNLDWFLPRPLRFRSAEFPLIVEENNTRKEYKVELQDIKFNNIVFDKTLHQIKDDEVFGVVEADVTGYILDYLTEDYIERVYEKIKTVEETTLIALSGVNTPIKTNTENKDFKLPSQIQQKAKVSGISQPVFENENSKTPFSWFKSLLILIGIIALLICAYYQLFAMIGLIVGLWILYSLIKHLPKLLPAFSFLFNIIATAFLVLFFFGFAYTLLGGLKTHRIKKYTTASDVKETKTENDSLIIHYREWEDYLANAYSGNLVISKRQTEYSENNRLRIHESWTQEAYNSMISNLAYQNNTSYQYLYSFFDSIKSVNKLNDLQFAEMMFTCIQDIPYVYISPKTVETPPNYDEYLLDCKMNNVQCLGNVKHGLYSPEEFIATLAGDCDTRTVCLFKILQHYGYSVAVLSNNIQHHSMIGISLPISGASTILNGERYVFWESTNKGLPPGYIDPGMTNTDEWIASLIFKN